MTCDRCKHLTDTAELFLECNGCLSSGVKCAACPTYIEQEKRYKAIVRYCDQCTAGQPHHEIHFDGCEGGLAAVAAKAGGFAVEAGGGTTGVTRLDAEVEDKLRIILSSLMQLEPLELLLVQNTFRHRTPAKLRETLRDLRDRLTINYDLRDPSEGGSSFRAVASLWKQKVLEKVPALRDTFAAVADETAGGGK